jgi:hypothetical protein
MERLSAVLLFVLAVVLAVSLHPDSYVDALSGVPTYAYLEHPPCVVSA